MTAAAVLALLLGATAVSAGADPDSAPGDAPPGGRIEVREEEDNVEITMVSTAPAAGAAVQAEEPVAEIPPGLTVAELVQRYITASRPERRRPLLERIGRTKPESNQDLRWLLNLFSRNAPATRRQTELSLQLLSESDFRLAPFFLALLQSEEPLFRTFGLIGAERLRVEEALPLIREIASTRFKHRMPAFSLTPKEADNWQVRYHALQVLALWEGEKTLPLLLKRSLEAPDVAALTARHFWEEILDRVVRWSESRRATHREAAAAAWRADIPRAALRKSAPRLRKLVADRRKKFETRHQAAVKLGVAADDAEVERLLKARAEASDEKMRLLLTTALFASRHATAIPLLVEYVKKDPAAIARAGALFQLRGMLPPERYRELLEWVVEHDEDEENRRNALRELTSIRSE
ncbi:MAG: hypothetical protein ABII00_18865 [Elusimicrobiota bacterium]